MLIDQSLTQGGWVDLGSYDFAAGDKQWVRLGDNYVNASDNGKSFAIDALRVTPVAGADAGTTTDAGVPGDDAGVLPDAAPDSGGVDADAATPSRGDTSAGSSGGCGCHLGHSAPEPPFALLSLLGLGLLSLRRRRGPRCRRNRMRRNP